nr:HAMP domain-containing histidine kinase [bacterium]
VQYISTGFIISVVLATILNLVLPLLGYSQFVNFGPYLMIIFVFFTSYAIIKFKMFDMKIIVTQLLVFCLWIFVFLRMLLSDSIQDKYIDGALLAVLIVVGIFLIKSVIREVTQREKIELLATDLQKANSRLTELDRQKSEFVSFATHQLRAPLTAMKGYSSLILEGDMGEVSKPVTEAISRIFDSSNTLTTIVDDYLNITRIELGTMKYAFETIDLKMLVEDVIAELKPTIDKKTGVVFTFTAENSGIDYRTTADRDKLKQVIVNLIDNSLKYTPSGKVDVSLSLDRPRHKFVFKLKDTGIGVAAETLPLLFNKFSRAGNANKVNIKGTGLGLFVAKEMVVAHHGVIRAESEGEGKGSTFIVELEPFSKA